MDANSSFSACLPCQMGDIISFAGRVAPYAFGPIGREMGYLIFYEGHFKELADRVRDLEASREEINHQVEAERRSGKRVEVGVQHWLGEVNEVIGRANQLLQDPRRGEVGCSGFPFPNFILRRRFSKTASEAAKGVVEVQGRRDFGQVAYLPALHEIASSSATREGEKLETRELFKEHIVKVLKDPNSRNIGVYGLSGVGKTHLVEEVFKIASKDKLFGAVVKARVSETPDIKTIQEQIAELLGLSFTERTVAGRAYRLRDRIEAEKTILVILDDIWTRLKLEEVGIPASDEHNGCKLLMTSIKENVLLQMDAQKDFTFRLELLNEAETWSLFQSMVGEELKDIRLQNVATQVAQKCGGLPLGIVTVACALRNKDIYAWKDALRQLENVGNAEIDAKIHSVLELSYNWLESDEMRALFLLFAVLQSNSAEYCLKVAMGLDTFKHISTVDDARNRFQKIIGSLKASCLLLEGNSSGQIQMHDRVREVAIYIASRDKNVFMMKPKVEIWPTNDFPRKCSQIILDQCQIHELPQRLDCPNVKLFILASANRSLEIPYTIFEGMENIRVLGLSHLNLSSLPTTFRFLTALQTLCLEQCVLENMNEIEALKNLEFLSFWKSSMNKLPSEIGKLTQLRMLDLSHSGIEVIPPNIISSLTKLEELYMGNTSIKWEDEISANQNENASLVELQQFSNLTALELQISEASILPDLQLMFEKLERYRIAIGDVWDWSDIKDKTLKTLMLKLGTNIHLEHGIKALIKGVENLYLDEVEGIQNVLYQLNWEGFPWLKHLHIQNNAKMKHIVDSAGRNQDRDSFPKLETLVLLNLRNLEQICHGPLAVNSFGKFSVIKVKNCVKLKYLLSFSMVKGLSQLYAIEVCQCNSMKKIVLGDINSSADNNIPNEKIEFLYLRSLTLERLRTLDNFFSYELTSSITKGMYPRVHTSVSAPLISAQVAFPNLDTLKLSSLNLNRIWDDNQHSMDKLTNLIVEKCDGLKYLFSSTVVRSFVNLKHLEISNCPMMEEIIAIEERNDGTSALEEVGFFKLEKIILRDMGSLKTIWHHQFKNLKTLQVNKCKKIVVVFPSSMQKAYNNLEMLEVGGCALVEEIFELTSADQSSIEDITHLKGITLHGLPKLKKIWSRDPQGTLSFGNLESVHLIQCGRLKHLFPLSVATCCSHLMELHIKHCGNMEEIVAESVNTTPIFEFNQLNTLLLRKLYKLKGFYAGNHILKCPSLRTIDVIMCAKLNLYKIVSTISPETTQDGKLPVLLQQAFIVEEVIPNLEKLRINQRDANMILQAQNLGALFTKMTFLGLSDYKNEEATFPYWFLQNVRTLEYLVVEWSSFEKIFQDERLAGEKILTRLKKLKLYHLPKLQHICEEGSQINLVLEHLEYLLIFHCPSLTNLLPSSVTFNHLFYLEITNCNGLINLITSHVAQSLAKLTIMKVKDCNSLEEIIVGEENVGIAFTSLQILTLECLPNLKKFCSCKCFLRFPLLERVVVSKCPRMKIFSMENTSTPILRKVKISENDEEWHWKGNLNDTIKNMFEDKVAFRSFKRLKLSKYPELKELWYDQLQRNVFRSLKYLVVHKCGFLSDVLFQPNLLEGLMNLEELDIKDCNSLEAVFDLKVQFAEELLVRNPTQLKKLTLSNLPKLKHVWKEDPHNTLRFQSLSKVYVTRCESLISLFPLSIAKDIMQLQNLQVYGCGIEEIVAKEEGMEEIVKFVFPHLTSLDLRNLPKLKAFFVGIHSLQCKSLKTIHVSSCPKLELFMTEPMRHQERARNDKLNVATYQPFFKMEEVLAIVENLTLNNKDFDIILQSQYSGVQFSKIKFIKVSKFTTEEATFPYWFLKNVPSLESLVVEWCSFTEVFQGEGSIGEERETQISSPLRKLKLYQLHRLQHICKGFQMDPILQHIEIINVGHCSSLIKLVPSSVTFKYLTDLEVTNCNGLINLITCSTAKSLVKLTTMKIKLCNLLEDVVNGKEDEKNNEIAFRSLKSLQLISLPRIHRFCSCMCPIMFPLLEELVVKKCPRMENFSLGETSAPNLQNVQIEENDEEYCWEGDLNRTLKNIFDDKVAFRKFKYLTLSEYPELKDLWYGQLHDNVFCNLKSLVVQRCDFLSDILFPSNLLQVLHGLEDLEVRDCDSLDAVFDVKGMKCKEILTKQITQLKRLTLSSLPKLKHIWNEDPNEIISFENLCVVDVFMCESLLNVFPLSLCKDLGRLKKLMIVSCGVEEIVAMEKGSMKCSLSFPQLTELVLRRLTNLKSFYPEKHTLECPSLKLLNVYRCEALRMFSFTDLDFQQPEPVDEIHDMLFRQALFSVEKLSPNLEELAINGTDALRILSGYHQGNTFHKIEFLRLQCFDETPTIFLNDFHAIFPNLVTLQVRNSSFETLFPTKGTIDHLNMQISKQVRNLWLFELEKLKYIWQEDFPLDHPLLQHLEVLRVINCPSLISLAPSSTSFTNLTYLKVDNCKELIYLITSSTSKSLVQLTTLKIINCEKMLDVVKIEEEKAEEDIIFENLEYLEFTSLSSLRSFCYGKHMFMFPSLLDFVVKGCPQMKIFSSGVTVAPFLTAIEVENEKKWWKDDFNTTIKQLFIEQELAHSK